MTGGGGLRPVRVVLHHTAGPEGLEGEGGRAGAAPGRLEGPLPTKVLVFVI